MGGDGGDGGGGDGRFAIPAADSGRATDCWLVWGRAAQLCLHTRCFLLLIGTKPNDEGSTSANETAPRHPKIAYSHAAALEV